MVWITVALFMISIYFYTYDKHTTNYLYMLEDKLREEVSWQQLVTNIPDAVACFNDRYECKYQNLATMKLFTVKQKPNDFRDMIHGDSI